MRSSHSGSLTSTSPPGDVRMGTEQAGLEVGDHVRSGWHSRRRRGASTKQPSKPVRPLAEGPRKGVARCVLNHGATPRLQPARGQCSK